MRGFISGFLVCVTLAACTTVRKTDLVVVVDGREHRVWVELEPKPFDASDDWIKRKRYLVRYDGQSIYCDGTVEDCTAKLVAAKIRIDRQRRIDDAEAERAAASAGASTGTGSGTGTGTGSGTGTGTGTGTTGTGTGTGGGTGTGTGTDGPPA